MNTPAIDERILARLLEEAATSPQEEALEPPSETEPLGITFGKAEAENLRREWIKLDAPSDLNAILSDPQAGAVLVTQVVGSVAALLVGVLLDMGGPDPVVRIEQQSERPYLEAHVPRTSRLAVKVGRQNREIGNDIIRVVIHSDSIAQQISTREGISFPHALWLWSSFVEAIRKADLPGLAPQLDLTWSAEGGLDVRLR